ncbi:MAG TPA: hypothetical protein VF618_14080 [Thermoanaerobaculia bacterium]
MLAAVVFVLFTQAQPPPVVFIGDEAAFEATETPERFWDFIDAPETTHADRIKAVRFFVERDPYLSPAFLNRLFVRQRQVEVTSSLGDTLHLLNVQLLLDGRPPDGYVDALLALPCTNGRDARHVLHWTQYWAGLSRRMTPEIIATWVELARKYPDLRGDLIDSIFRTVELVPEPEVFGLAEVALVELLDVTKDSELQRFTRGLRHLHPARPDALELLVARRINRMNRELHAQNRGAAAYQFFLHATHEQVSEPQSNHLDSSQHEAMFSRFRTWYCGHQEELIAAGRAHAPRLRVYEEQLTRVKTCAAE